MLYVSVFEGKTNKIIFPYLLVLFTKIVCISQIKRINCSATKSQLFINYAHDIEFKKKTK